MEEDDDSDTVDNDYEPESEELMEDSDEGDVLKLVSEEDKWFNFFRRRVGWF